VETVEAQSVEWLLAFSNSLSLDVQLWAGSFERGISFPCGRGRASAPFVKERKEELDIDFWWLLPLASDSRPSYLRGLDDRHQQESARKRRPVSP
jgi:hypothetical protein